MDYDFGKFLNESKIRCKTRNDFIGRIENEINLTEKIDGEHLERKLYIKRLDNAKFCAERGAIKEKDDYNDSLLSLLDRLV